ncbi:hypothetical protein DMC01_09375 [Campylobacter troglodytis]|nr:hypothetical protein DMC01_09375 [Campylobacter troglodytis]
MLHFKETKFRSNAKIKQQDLYKILLKTIKQNPLKFGLSLFFATMPKCFALIRQARHYKES